jgi:hypothetical protein
MSHPFAILPYLDPPTLEWIESFEGPEVPYLETRPRSVPSPAAPEIADPLVADWAAAQEFPTQAFLFGMQGESNAAQPACRNAVARFPKKNCAVGVPDSRRAVSKLVYPPCSAVALN